MRVMNDFMCGDCGTVTEKFVDVEFKTIECPECHGDATLLQAMPTVKLDGCSGDFPGASERWARIREEKARIRAKRA